MAEPWIKLRIHSEHPKVLRISALTKIPKETVLAMAVRWFRHVDAYLPDDNCIIDAAGINAVVQFVGDANKGQTMMTFVDALRDEHVQWLSDVLGGGYRIPEYEKHFSANAKRRGDESLRKKRKRASAKCPQKSGQMSAPLSISSLSSSAPFTEKEDAEKKTDPPPRPVRARSPGTNIPPTLAECVAYGATIGMDAQAAEYCWQWWESAGWRRKGGPVKNWQRTMDVWSKSPFGNAVNNRNGGNGEKPKPQWLLDRLAADEVNDDNQ